MEVGNSFAACRLCLCQSESFSGVFDYCDGYTPAEMIIELMRFEVSSTDIYPQCVCSTCVKKLTDFKKFKELCCVFKASFDRAYCSKYGGVTFGITSFPIGQTDVPSRIERIIWVEGACKQEEFVSHPKDTIPNEDEEELIVPDDLNAPVSVSTLPIRDVVKEENVTNVENPTETVTDADTMKYITELDSHSDANENPVDVKNHRDSSEVLAVVENSEKCAVLRIVAGSHADRKENACEVEGTMDSGAVGRVTRSMVVAKEKKKVMTAGSSEPHSQDDDAVDSLDDLEDSESNFQPEDMVDSDISSSSDKEFLPTPPKRTKNEAKGPDHPEMEDHGISSLSSSSETEDSDEDDNDDDDELESKRRNVKPVHSSEKGVYDCSLCGKRYFQRRTFRYHMDQHKFGNRFKCKICGKAFHRKVYLRSHMDVHQTEMNFQCDVCGKAFKSSALLYCHKKTHGEKNYACELCGKKFITVTKLNHHLKCHNRDKRYPCEKCGKTFTKKDYVTQHVKTVHLKQTKYKYSCEVCGRKCETPAALKSHRMIHTGERPFKCSVCDKAFRTKCSLEKHVNTHTKEKSYKCDVCDAVLSTVTSLARHKARHAGEMKYKCDNCGKQYTQSHNLKNHLKKCHTDSG
ncbi:zinc finger protein 83-like isoform X2 [Ischnura elegans]|uniref:zinc finger protein 83-like isoform X2 n=1 Tax=Ischnura elegans TaxID=197161 RepID=UPI001ED89E9C|nr:zinc finger protein 83-like isoform X2 [Ischnura elegans]